MPIRFSSAWAAYPAVVAASAVSAGIFLASRSGVGVCGWLVSISVAVAIAALLHVHSPLRDRLLKTPLLFLTLAGLVVTGCVGGLRFTTYYALPAEHDLLTGRASGEETEWTSRITEPPVYSAGSIRFVVRLAGDGPPASVMVSGRSPSGPPLELCDELILRGRLESLPRLRNPGDFDYGRYLARRRIYARLFLADDGVVRLGRKHGGPVCATERVRATIRLRLERYVWSASSRAVLQALILGDRGALDESVRDRFARMGLLHLLAVSGLHVMVVGMIVYRLLGPTLKRLNLCWRTADGIRTGATTALLLGYMLLTGCSASVVRAVVMAILFLGSTTLQRPSRSVNTLGVATTALLLARPSHLFEPGFQLSVSAVGAILTLVPQITRWIPPPRYRVGRHLHTATSVTVAATIGTLPVVLYHFGQVGLAGLVLNLPSIPLTTAALSAGVATVALGGAARNVGEILGASADVLATALLNVAAYGDRLLGWTVVRWRLDEPAVIAALLLLTAALAVRHAPRIRWRCVFLALLFIVAHLAHGVIGGQYRPQLDVIFLDVGQGDAAILRLPDGNGVLIDAGPRSLFSDAGTRVILPQLAYHGIRRLSAVVITHPDSDHLGGLPAVLRSVPVSRVIRSGYVHDSGLFLETNGILDSLGVRHQTARTGDTLSFSPVVRGYVLHPPESNDGRASNDHSVVLLIRFGKRYILLTGDAPVGAELAIARAFGDMVKSDLLKVGHHGSRTSSSAAFLAHVARGGEVNSGARNSAPYAVVSVARSNRFGLPDEDVLARLHRAGFRVIQTSTDGAVWFRSDGRRLERVFWRPR